MLTQATFQEIHVDTVYLVSLHNDHSEVVIQRMLKKFTTMPNFKQISSFQSFAIARTTRYLRRILLPNLPLYSNVSNKRTFCDNRTGHTGSAKNHIVQKVQKSKFEY